MSTKSIEVSGKNEDEAIEKALEMLGLSRDDVSVEIIERAKTGFLGLKSTPAVVKVVYEDDNDESDDFDISAAQSEKPAKKEKTSPSSEPAQAVDSREPSVGGKKDAVEAFLVGLFEKMDVPVEMKITESADSIDVSLKAGAPGILIGRRGETLDAIQHLTNYVVNRSSTNRIRINVDAEDYRQRRNETLEGVAARTAAKVLKNRRNMTLEPMNAYERHVIHTALQDRENINTFSVGSEPNRRVVVAYGKSGDSGYRGKRPPKSSFSEPSEFENNQADDSAPADSYTPQPSEGKSYREWS